MHAPRREIDPCQTRLNAGASPNDRDQRAAEVGIDLTRNRNTAAPLRPMDRRALCVMPQIPLSLFFDEWRADFVGGSVTQAFYQSIAQIAIDTRVQNAIHHQYGIRRWSTSYRIYQIVNIVWVVIFHHVNECPRHSAIAFGMRLEEPEDRRVRNFKRSGRRLLNEVIHAQDEGIIVGIESIQLVEEVCNRMDHDRFTDED
ncbi:MAG: hypothetical protein KDB14_05810 [Planctomycetales bacterium]|nr:hypothetical protein [Planctomycetales bacterium]